MKSRLRLKVSEARQRGMEFKDGVQIKTKVCEARQRGVELKDKVKIEIESL